jgi:hypothetical protein
MDKSCKEFTMIWNLKISKSKLSILQLVRKEHGTKDQEYGSLLPTPTQDSVSERTKKYKQGGTPLTMAVRQMFPTPSASCCMDVVAPPETVQKNSQGWSVTRVKSGVKYGAKLNDVVNKINNKPGGKLNPNFVEFLMGYNMDWTKIDHTESKHLETQSYHKSQQKSVKQLSKQRNKNDR